MLGFMIGLFVGAFIGVCVMCLCNAAAIIDVLKKNKPPEGLVQILSVTEKQFSKIEIITGDYSSDTVDSDERLLML